MKNRKLLVLSSIALTLTAVLPIVGCSKPNNTVVTDLGYFTPSENLFNATIDSLVSKDVYGRETNESLSTTSDRLVGMFYFVWHGNHINDIYNVSELEKNNPDELWSMDSTISKFGEFHYFDEPLYDYYSSDDPWVNMRHTELLTMSGIDYLALDLTNFGLYLDNIDVLLDTLLTIQKQGWNVPKITSFLNGTSYAANHVQRITDFYNNYYTNPKYDSLWYRDINTGLPIIIIDKQTTYQSVNYFEALPTSIKEKITFRNARWPYDKGETIYDDASWMDWQYPQYTYHNSTGNYMSVSVAQHTGNTYGTGGSFGLSVNPATKDDPRYNGNKGRGYNYETGKNVTADAFKGTNLEQQWKNAIYCEEQIDEVFVTGWNEWIAYKQDADTLRGMNIPENGENIVDFCDTCDDEFSRDLEMTKGAYGDNFYLQNMRLTRDFKSKNIIKYYGRYATESLHNLDWSNARTYLDFEGDAMTRHHLRADKAHGVYLDNNTNRNDIVSTKVSNDSNNLYIQVKTKDNIVIDSDASNNLNILLSIKGSNKPSWEGYQYILNRTPLANGDGVTALEKVTANEEFDFEKVIDCFSYRKDNTFSVAIPLSSLGIDDDEFTIDLKVADGISEQGEIMNYYIDGDSAPIGRLNYRYNSKHK